LLDMAPQATAILSMSVMQAIQVVNEAKRRGRHIPRDLSVVGFNDTVEAALCQPPVTTVDTRTTEKGRLAAKLVLAGESGRQIILAPTLVIRSSTAQLIRK
jgi:LacI family transcriptional regulator